MAELVDLFLHEVNEWSEAHDGEPLGIERPRTYDGGFEFKGRVFLSMALSAVLQHRLVQAGVADVAEKTTEFPRHYSADDEKEPA